MFRNALMIAVVVISFGLAGCQTGAINTRSIVINTPAGKPIASVPHGAQVAVAPAAFAAGDKVKCNTPYRAGSVVIGPARTGACGLEFFEADFAVLGQAVLGGAFAGAAVNQQLGWVRAVYIGGLHSDNKGCRDLKVGDMVYVPVYMGRSGPVYQAWSKACDLQYVAGRKFFASGII